MHHQEPGKRQRNELRELLLSGVLAALLVLTLL